MTYEVSDLQKAVKLGDPEFPVLQRALPAGRSGKLGFGQIRDPRSARPQKIRTEMKTTLTNRARRPDRHLVRLRLFARGAGHGRLGGRARHRDPAGRTFAGWKAWYFAVLALLILAPSIWAASVTARLAGKKDPGMVVVDEVIGQWITLAGASSLNWKSYLVAFVLFRLLDIWKPPPVRQLEALPGGTGIMADDVMAGVYAALVLFMAGWFNLY